MTKWDIAVGVWLGIGLHEMVKNMTLTVIEIIRRTR